MQKFRYTAVNMLNKKVRGFTLPPMRRSCGFSLPSRSCIL